MPAVRLDWEIAKRGWRRYAAYPVGHRGRRCSRTRSSASCRPTSCWPSSRTGPTSAATTRGDAVTYVWLAQALLMTVYIFGWQELALRIRDGSIATDLSRPLDPQRYWLAFDLGRAPYHLIFRGVPPFVVGRARLRPPLPVAARPAVAFVVSLALAVVVSFGFRFLYNSAAFWLIDYPRCRHGLDRSMSLFFSGLTIRRSPSSRTGCGRSRTRCRSRRSCRRRSTSGSASTRARSSRASSRCRRSGRWRCSRSGGSCSARRDAEAGDPGWLTRVVL